VLFISTVNNSKFYNCILRLKTNNVIYYQVNRRLRTYKNGLHLLLAALGRLKRSLAIRSRSSYLFLPLFSTIITIYTV
jgi:hypothetical protein